MNEIPVVTVHDFLMSQFQADILKARHVFSKEGKIPVKLPVRSSYDGHTFFRTYWKRPQDITPEHMKYVLPEYQKMLKNPKPDDEAPSPKLKDEYEQREKHSEEWEKYKAKYQEEYAKKKAAREQKRKEREEERKRADPNYKPKTWQRGRKRLDDKEWEKRRKEEWERNARLEYRDKQRELYPDDPDKWEIPADMKFTPPNDPNMWKRKTPYKTKEQKAEAKVFYDKEAHEASKERWYKITIGGKHLDQVFRIPKELITPPPDITDPTERSKFILDATQKYVYDAIVNPIMSEYGCTAKEARRIALDYMEAYGIVWHLGGERWKRHERDCVNWCHAVQKLKRYMWANPNDGSPPEEPPEPAKPEPEPAKPEIPDGVTVNGINFTGEVLSSIKAARWEKGGKTYVVNTDSFLNEASLVIRRSMTQLGHNPSKVTACNFDPAASKAIPTFKCVVEDDEGGSHEVTVKASTRRVEWNELQEEPEIPEITPPEEPEDITPPEEPEEPEEEITPPEEPEEPKEPEKYQPKLKFLKTAFAKDELKKIPLTPGFRCDMDELKRRIGEYLEDNLGIEDIKSVKLVEIIDYEPQEGGDIELNVTYVKNGSKEEEEEWVCLDNSGLRQYDTQDSYFVENIPNYSPSGRKIDHDKLLKLMFDEFKASIHGSGLKVGQRFNLKDIEIVSVSDKNDDPSQWIITTKARVEVFTGNRKVREFTWEEPMFTKNSYHNEDGVLDKAITAKPSEPTAAEKKAASRAEYLQKTKESRDFWQKRYMSGNPNYIPPDVEQKFSKEEQDEFDAFDKQLEKLGNELVRRYGTRMQRNAVKNLQDKYAKLPKTADNQHKLAAELAELNNMIDEYDKIDNMRNSYSARLLQRRRTIERHTSGWRPDLEFDSYDTTTDDNELFGTDKDAFARAVARITEYINEDDNHLNCQRCAYATNMLRMGYDVKASKSVETFTKRGARVARAVAVDPDTGKEVKAKDILPINAVIFDAATRGGGSYTSIRTSKEDGIRQIYETMKNTQGDARFGFRYTWSTSAGRRGGHIIYAEKKGDAIIMVDTQNKRGWSNQIHDASPEGIGAQLNMYETTYSGSKRCKFDNGDVIRLDTITDYGFDYGLYVAPKKSGKTQNRN